MPDQKFMQELENLTRKYPDEAEGVFVEAPGMLENFNEVLAASGKVCKRVGVNPTTGKIVCLEWENT